MAKILYNGDEYELHLVKLKDKEINRLKKGDALLFFNKDSRQVISIEKD